MKSRNQHRRSSGRRAVVTVMVLIVLLLLSGIVVQFVRRAVSDRRQGRQELILEQTRHLADAGVAKLRKHLSNDPAWPGETWNIPVGVIHQANSGRVVITVEGQNATLVALYPLESESPARITRTIRLSDETSIEE